MSIALNRVAKPPQVFATLPKPWLFLAGSIEMGTAVDWQAAATALALARGWSVLNPRRDDWDVSWKQEIGNHQFYNQVTWELMGLELCDKAIVYFAPGTQSPVSLMELGLFAWTSKLIVVCPDGFWRKGNVDIVCQRYGVKQAPDIASAIERL